ncbi:LYR motif-containing protein 2 isoform X1 [Antennarius striatus]|uniref:LYR motif-containing protein 2 isoform X1 n=1 Tax=Antennarius striatus TaxID=241820 RepID=UPI0035B3E162
MTVSRLPHAALSLKQCTHRRAGQRACHHNVDPGADSPFVERPNEQLVRGTAPCSRAPRQCSGGELPAQHCQLTLWVFLGGSIGRPALPLSIHPTIHHPSIHTSYIQPYIIHPTIHHTSNHTSYIQPYIIHPTIQHTSNHTSFIQPYIIHPTIHHTSNHTSYIQPYIIHPTIHHSSNHTSFIHLYIIHPTIHHTSNHTSYIQPYIIHTYIHHTYIHTSYIHPYIIHPYMFLKTRRLNDIIIVYIVVCSITSNNSHSSNRTREILQSCMHSFKLEQVMSMCSNTINLFFLHYNLYLSRRVHAPVTLAKNY